jgi:hypothetical protein
MQGQLHQILSRQHSRHHQRQTSTSSSMVLLTMTPVVAAAVKIYTEAKEYVPRPDETPLEAPEPGSPISHGQLVDISKYLKANPEKARARISEGKDVPIYLSELLRGCSIYTPPPKTKAEPVRLAAFVMRCKVLIVSTDCRIQTTHGPAPQRRRGPVVRTDAQPAAAFRNPNATVPSRLPRPPLPTNRSGTR